jgi:hypothetical protein
VRGCTRCSWGASLDSKEHIETGWIARGSLRRVGDGKVVGSDVDDDGGSNKALPAVKVWTQTGYKVVRFSSR